MNKLISKSLVSVATATILATGFAGCGDTTSQSSQTAGSIQAVKGTVIGQVTDTNGQPIVGASVTLAGQTSTTTATGTYTFENVTTTGTSDDTGNTDDLSVIITAANHLGATVTVSTTANLTQGFIAEAGNAVLPALTATVTGRLVADGTLGAISNTEIALDFISTNEGITDTDAQDNAKAGATTKYAVETYKIKTEADGSFTINNVPADSTLRFVSGNYIFNSIDENTVDSNVTTRDEVAVVAVGLVRVTPITTIDNIRPYVVNVQSTIGGTTTLDKGVLGFTTPFVLDLSEAIGSTLDATSVTLFNEDTKKYIPVTVSLNATKTQLTVQTDADLAENTNFTIALISNDFKDTAGNALSAQLADGNATIETTSNATSLNIAIETAVLTTYNSVVTDPSVVTDLTLESTDAVVDADLAALISGDATFTDVNGRANLADNDATVYQLNDANATTLSTLATEINRVAGLGSYAVDVNTARISFTQTDAASYQLDFASSISRTIAVQETDATDLPQVGGVALSKTSSFIIPKRTGTGKIELLITGVDASDLATVTITPIDDLNNTGTVSAPLVLKDNVEPTVVLQNAYGQQRDNNSTATSTASTSKTFGNGSELANTGTSTTGTIGVPYYFVNTGMLDNLIVSQTAVYPATVANNGVIISDDNLFAELHYNNTINSTSTATDNRQIGNEAYDATAYSKFNKTRTVAIAFSEGVDLTGVTLPVYTGSAALSNFKVTNDVLIDDALGPVTVDLVQFDVDNIEKFQADENKTLDFTGIKDTVGNVATTAKAAVKDTTPPLMTKATWNAQSLVLTFNEPLAAITTYNNNDTASDVNFIADTNVVYSIDINSSNYNDDNYSVSGNTLTIKRTAFGLTGLSSFTGASYAELGMYNDVNGNPLTANVPHANIDYSGVKDNSNNLNSWASNAGTVAAPLFAGVDIVPDLAVSNLSGKNQPNQALTFQISMNQTVNSLYDTNRTTSAVGVGVFGAFIDNIVETNNATDLNGSVTNLTTLVAQNQYAMNTMYLTYENNLTKFDINATGLNINVDTNVTVNGSIITFVSDLNRTHLGLAGNAFAAANPQMATSKLVSINWRANSNATDVNTTKFNANVTVPFE
jgi:hypothetical protein